MRILIGAAIVTFSAVLGSTTGVAQAAPGLLAAPPRLTLSAESVSASRTIGADAAQLRANATYELVSSQTRRDPSSVAGESEHVQVLARVKTNANGKFSTRFVVPLRWRHDHLIEVRKVKGYDLVKGANDWITVTRPRPSLALGATKVEAGSRVRIIVSGVRPNAKYVVFSREKRDFEGCNCRTGTTSDGPGFRSFRTDANGRSVFKLTVGERWRNDYLIEFKKAKGDAVVSGANAWLTVVR